VRASHERWDGRGYPDGLTGEDIPLGSRVIAVCDAFHAMTEDRVYRKAMSQEGAIAEIERCAGSQFDPVCVGALIAVIRGSGAGAARDRMVRIAQRPT
jgi:HD-GYP domain-containing protein (c-di-GMP phosphodiesterase class II)